RPTAAGSPTPPPKAAAMRFTSLPSRAARANGRLPPTAATVPAGATTAANSCSSPIKAKSPSAPSPRAAATYRLAPPRSCSTSTRPPSASNTTSPPTANASSPTSPKTTPPPRSTSSSTGPPNSRRSKHSKVILSEVRANSAGGVETPLPLQRRLARKKTRVPLGTRGNRSKTLRRRHRIRRHNFLLLLGVLPLLDRSFRQGNLQHFIHETHVVDVQALELLRRQVFFHVHLVVGRQDHVAHVGALRRQHFLFHAADRQHVPAQRDLAGHRQIRTHRPVRQQ